MDSPPLWCDPAALRWSVPARDGGQPALDLGQHRLLIGEEAEIVRPVFDGFLPRDRASGFQVRVVGLLFRVVENANDLVQFGNLPADIAKRDPQAVTQA